MPRIEYVTVRWETELLDQFGLPDIDYPVPTQSLEPLLASGGALQFTDMLFWMQEYSARSCENWLAYEPAMLRLSALIVPEELPEAITIEADTWCLFVAPVDLTKEIVTIQRGSHLVAAVQDYGDGRVVASAYRPLDGKSTEYLRELSGKPNPDGTVCMRPNNWEYALDCSAGMGNAYAAERGEAYLSYWQFGLGISHDGSRVDAWHAQRDVKPILSGYTAMHIAINYQRSDEWSMN